MRAGIVILFLLFIKSLHGQCPDRDFLWHRIIYLRDSTKVPHKQQLNELLLYLDNINKCAYKNDSTHALLLKRIGILYASQKNFSSAIEYTNKSITLINEQKHRSSINPAHVISAYFNLNALYDSLKLENKKSAAVDSCIRIALRLHKGYDYALNALVIKVRQLFESGDYYGCISYVNLGESLVLDNKKSLNYAEYFETNCFTWKINSLIFLNKNSDAEKFVLDKIKQDKENRSTELLGTLYGLYGQINLAGANATKALVNFKKSFYYNKEIKHSDGCAEALNNIGFAYSTSLHQPKMALQFYFKALKFADANESLNILDNIANIYAGEGNFDSAFFFFQKAFDQLQPGFTEKDLLKSNIAELPGSITEYITGMVLDKGSACLSKYKATGNKECLKEAIRIYQLADQYFDKLRVSQYEIQSKLFWKTNSRRLYEQAIEACYTSRNIEKAFYFFEKSRSILLNDQIMEQHGMNDQDIAKQAQLKKNILEIERNLQNLPAASQESISLQQQLFINKQGLDILIKNISNKHLSYQNYLDTASLNLEMVLKRILTTSKTLLEIFSGDSTVYVLNITTSNQTFTQINKHLYDSLTRLFNSLITNPDRLNKNYKVFTQTGWQLYRLLFQDKAPPGGSIIISPDGVSYPFEALVVNGDDKHPDYFLNHYATSYTYSAKYLTNEFAMNTNTDNSVLGMAPVQYNYQHLAELEGSDKSLGIINGYFSNAANYVLEKATKNNFLQNFPRYSVIQLYTHAARSADNSNDPVIYFFDSSFLLSDLITDRKPITQLVVLSACETANGKLYEGEGIFSFNRGFAALGIPAAVSNLWSVDNVSTYRITELFYKYLAADLPTDIALQKAKLEFINTSSSKDRKLPYFWAGPILTGKVDTIKSKVDFPWKVVAIVVILLLCIGYYSKKIILKRK